MISHGKFTYNSLQFPLPFFLSILSHPQRQHDAICCAYLIHAMLCNYNPEKSICACPAVSGKSDPEPHTEPQVQVSSVCILDSASQTLFKYTSESSGHVLKNADTDSQTGPRDCASAYLTRFRVKLLLLVQHSGRECRPSFKKHT